ncbi:MAG TPA: hypothetical protein VNT81_09330 [Vicinamibacterales bacterium]|nr:hypothetical protein [Vicinamibacterales bacterium]
MAVRNHRLAALVFFAFLAVLHSWPLASNPAGLARLDNHDAELNTWIISWVPHALVTSPLNLFHAPIFHPERYSLAFSEHMLVPSLFGAPLIWAGVSPVLVYNLLIMLGFTLSGFAMYWVMAAWTGSQSAALIAGLAYAFNAHVLTRFVHLQAMHVEFFPIVLYAFDRVLTQRRVRDGVLLAAAFVLQALCSNYLMVFTTYALIACAVVRWRELPVIGRAEGSPGPLLIAAGISIILLAPFLWPYYQVDQAYGLARSVDVVTQYNAGWRDYLVTGGRLHYQWWSHALYEGRTALFPGITVGLLAMAALFAGRGLADPRIRMTLALGVVGVAFSLGTSLPGYSILHDVLPLLSGLRNVARWGWLALAAAAILAGFAAAALERRHRRRSLVIAITLCVLITGESIRTPVGYTPFNGMPKIYDRFAGNEVVVAEFPFYAGASVAENGRYVLANTRYFQPLLNGYSGFHPEPFLARGRALGSFPSEQALAELKVAGVTDVLVHVAAFRDRYSDAALQAIDTVPTLQFVVEEDGIRLYRLK